MNYLVILLSACIFALAFIFNDFFFRSFGLSDYVSLLFIPSGIRIFFALVFDIYGVVGILLGSLLVSLFYLNQSDLTVVVTTACVAAGAAWFARWASLTLLKLDINLANIKLMDLLQVSIIFSAISATSHHLLFIQLGMSEDFTSGALAMFAGDVTGALLCLFLARTTLRLMRLRS